jgi:hypothetical protein
MRADVLVVEKKGPSAGISASAIPGAGGVTCGDCPAGFTNDGAKGCKEGCRVTGTIYGKHVATMPNLVGYSGCEPGLHILIKHDKKHYKMVGVKIKDAKASSNPPGIAKYVTAAKGSISLNKDTVCKMFKGEGYKTKVYDYELKGVTVSGC